MNNSHFDCTQEVFKKLLPSVIETQNLDELRKAWLGADVCEEDKRSVLDGALKDHILEVTDFKAVITTAILLSRAELCTASTPVVLLSDLFDISTLSNCRDLFSFVEDQVSVWKDDLFFTAGKNHMLRMCNDLLRRLSRSQNTTFRGRILLFLASYFPFSERSGLNIPSEFNLESANEYKKGLNEDEVMETEEGGEEEEVSLKLDYNLYNKFLTLQDFFRNPAQCYNKAQWGSFALSWTDIFQTFQNMKLDAVDFSRKSAREHLEDSEEGSHFFAKYLTNPRLLQLQLSDPNFRRSLIIQGLITLQYLNSTVKSKPESYELRPVQQDWVKEQETLLYSLLAETPKGSERFRDIVRQMLVREQIWNSWKNDGCPELKRPAAAEEVVWGAKRARTERKDIATLLKMAASRNKYYMGTKELTALWNINPKNLDGCKGPERAFVPTFDSYLGEAVAQMDPAAGIEPEYKKVNDPDFVWRAFRLLAQRSACFFSATNSPIIRSLPDFLESCLKQVVKDQKSAAGEDIDSNKDDGEEDSNEKKELPARREDTKLTDEAIEIVSNKLGDQWLRLAAKLGYNSSADAQQLMRSWVTDDVDATAENIAYILEGLQLTEAAEYVKSLCA